MRSCRPGVEQALQHTFEKTRSQHPRTAEFVAQGLYAVNSFKEPEAKISALESKDERGAAFEVFAEAFLVTQEIFPNPGRV
jgi:hypothetical protein